MGCGESKRRTVSSPSSVIREEFTIETLVGEQETFKIDPQKPISALYDATKSLFEGRYSAFRLFSEGKELTSALLISHEKKRHLTLVPWPNAYIELEENESRNGKGKLTQ